MLPKLYCPNAANKWQDNLNVFKADDSGAAVCCDGVDDDEDAFETVIHLVATNMNFHWGQLIFV